MNVPADVRRFRVAQERGGVEHGATYQRAITELREGRKESHWIWYVLPQARSGGSVNAREYQIRDRAEVEAYVADDVLWSRLTECVEAIDVAVANVADSRRSGDRLLHVMGSDIDRQKAISCFTLFSLAVRGDTSERTRRFREIVGTPDAPTRIWDGNEPCSWTLALDWWVG